jgi:hypothetical protein
MSTAARRLGFSFAPPKKTRAGKQPHKRVIIDGITFASDTEGEFYLLLKLWRAAGRITAIECHPPFPFQAKFTNARGIKRRARRYTADFRVTLADGSTRVYEVKGAKKKDRVVVGPYIVNETEFKLRRDAVELQYGIAIWTVYPDGGRWIDADTKEALAWT